MTEPTEGCYGRDAWHPRLLVPTILLGIVPLVGAGLLIIEGVSWVLDQASML